MTLICPLFDYAIPLSLWENREGESNGQVVTEFNPSIHVVTQPSIKTGIVEVFQLFPKDHVSLEFSERSWQFPSLDEPRYTSHFKVTITNLILEGASLDEVLQKARTRSVAR